MSKKKYVSVGAIMKRKKENESDPTEYYIKLDKETTVTIDGDTVTGGYLNVSKPSRKYEAMVARAARQLEEGEINEDEFEKIQSECEEKSARYAKDGDLSFITQELQYVRKN